jgi:hypothetical protein
MKQIAQVLKMRQGAATIKFPRGPMPDVIVERVSISPVLLVDVQ